MYFYNARYYDPYLNRFLSPDSIIPDPQNPQDLNRYSYTRNNPLRYTDPTGHYANKTHHSVTTEQGFQVVANLDALAIDQSVSLPSSFSGGAVVSTIADSNRSVDTSLATASTWPPNLTKEYADTGVTVAEYWHFTSLADAESRLQQAIEAQDAQAFGQGLHAYQDYWAHTRNGFTIPTSQAGSDRLGILCPECAHLLPDAGTRSSRASMLGHARVRWPDGYTPADDYWNDANMRGFDRNDTSMRRGTYYWLVMFLCRQYGIDPQEYWDTYGEVTPPE